jgi:hypothetical protein
VLRQRFKIGWSTWRATTDEERAHQRHEKTATGDIPSSGSTSGLLAYANG